MSSTSPSPAWCMSWMAGWEAASRRPHRHPPVVVAYAPMSGGGGKRNWKKAIVAGGLTGAVEACISYPTEFIKTQLQLFEEKAKAGPIQCARDTIRKDGVLGLYRGLSSLLYFSVPKVATRFFAYETMANQLKDEKGKMSVGKTLLCGLVSGVAEAIVAVTPMDTIKTRLIHDQLTRAPADRRYKGFFHGVSTIVKEQGLSGVYKGLTATVLKQGSNQAIRWLVFSRTKDFLTRDLPPAPTPPIYVTIIASVLAGAASVYGNTPVDVIKTRMQWLQADKYKGVWDCATQIARKEGLTGFYKGATARLARVCLDVTVVMVLYEQMNKVLDMVWKD